MFELISELWHSIRGHCMGSNLFLILKSTGCSPWQWTQCHYQTFTALAMDFIIFSNVVCLCSSWVYIKKEGKYLNFSGNFKLRYKNTKNSYSETGINMDQKLPSSEIHWIKEHETRSFFQGQWCQMPSLLLKIWQRGFGYGIKNVSHYVVLVYTATITLGSAYM